MPSKVGTDVRQLKLTVATVAIRSATTYPLTVMPVLLMPRTGTNYRSRHVATVDSGHT